MYFILIMPRSGRERDAAHEWANGPYIEHQWLWRFFPAAEGAQRDFLFRRWDMESIPRFYVVSERPPRPLNTAWSVQTQNYAPKVDADARLRFDLRANPVVTHNRDGRRTRHDVVMHQKKKLLQERGIASWQNWQDDNKPTLYALVHETCSAWLRSRSSRLGFDVDEASLAVDGYQQHVEKNGRLRFSTVDFSGTLTVTDPKAFVGVLHRGIGPAKAFGCGLLLVRRLR